VPVVSVPTEIINDWDDWTQGRWCLFKPPIFSVNEVGALQIYDDCLNNVCSKTLNGCLTYLY